MSTQSDIVREGAGTDAIHFILDGWCCRYRLLRDGRRQLPTLLLPGDICDLDALFLRRVHFGVAALTPCVIASIPREVLRALIDDDPEIRDLFWWLQAVENSTATEWAVALGRRSTEERLAHLICELLVRLTVVGQAQDLGFAFPLTQQELGDALGTSTVHINRTLQLLRGRDLIRQTGRQMTIRDWNGLKSLANFNPDYLHTDGTQLPRRESAAIRATL